MLTKTKSNASEEEIIILKPTAVTKYKTSYYNPYALTNATQQATDTFAYDVFTEKCEICNTGLQEPYIKCSDCQVLLCVHCFAQGCEKAAHRNTHSYVIVRDDIQVFSVAGGAWTAREERTLLTALQTSGYGNWEAVARALRWQRTPDECRQHYHNCYFGGIFERLLGLSHPSQTYFPERMPYVMKMRSIDPPRYDDISSIQLKSMGGYRCARGDFDTPYDTSAESFLTELQDLSAWEDDAYEWREVAEVLQLAVLRAYNHRLK